MPDNLSDGERRLRARMAAHASWRRTLDPTARTAAARRAALAKFERQVDPDGTMPSAVRARLAEHARREHLARIALASAASRRERTAQRRDAELLDDLHGALDEGEATL